MATIVAPAPSTVRRPAPARAALWALQVVLAAVFVFAAWGKVTLDPMTVTGFEVMGLGPTGAVVVGVLELLGAVALLVPRLAGLSAFALVALMVGAVVLSAVFLGTGPLLAIPGVTLLLVAVVAVARRHEVPALVRTVTRRA